MSTTSLELKEAVEDETGSGALVFAHSPKLITPSLGKASATSINGAIIAGGILNGYAVGYNTGDQTSIVGIIGTKAEFNAAITDGDILYAGDVSALTDGNKGDVTVASSGTSITVNNGAITAAKTSITGTPNGAKFLRDDFS